ncbi:hypothetical protein ACFL2M_02070 [Patescibacteria group bacterium]
MRSTIFSLGIALVAGFATLTTSLLPSTALAEYTAEEQVQEEVSAAPELSATHGYIQVLTETYGEGSRTTVVAFSPEKIGIPINTCYADPVPIEWFKRASQLWLTPGIWYIGMFTWHPLGDADVPTYGFTLVPGSCQKIAVEAGGNYTFRVEVEPEFMTAEQFEAQRRLESTIHWDGHFGIGGTMYELTFPYLQPTLSAGLGRTQLERKRSLMGEVYVSPGERAGVAGVRVRRGWFWPYRNGGHVGVHAGPAASFARFDVGYEVVPTEEMTWVMCEAPAGINPDRLEARAPAVGGLIGVNLQLGKWTLFNIDYGVQHMWASTVRLGDSVNIEVDKEYRDLAMTLDYTQPGFWVTDIGISLSLLLGRHG